MRRRTFLADLASMTVAYPLAARAQRPAVPVIGFLGTASAGGYRPMVTAFREGLRESAYVEGQNLAIEYRAPTR